MFAGGRQISLARLRQAFSQRIACSLVLWYRICCRMCTPVKRTRKHCLLVRILLTFLSRHIPPGTTLVRIRHLGLSSEQRRGIAKQIWWCQVTRQGKKTCETSENRLTFAQIHPFHISFTPFHSLNAFTYGSVRLCVNMGLGQSKLTVGTLSL